jgi:hypothetical protein
LLPEHGRVDCSRCFEGKPVVWGKTAREVNGWKIESNAGAWGSRNPVVLVLGVSKGPNQTKNILRMKHEEIPFKGERAYLSKYLTRLGLLNPNESIDSRISAEEADFAFGSMVRCGIGLWSEVKKDYVKVGNVVNSSATQPQAQEFVKNCSQEFLASLPERLKLVVLMSNDDEYMESCFWAFKALHPNVKRFNDVSYTNDQVMWVHIIHAAGTAGRHREDWLHGETGKQAKKRELAIQAIQRSGVLGAINA